MYPRGEPDLFPKQTLTRKISPIVFNMPFALILCPFGSPLNSSFHFCSSPASLHLVYSIIALHKLLPPKALLHHPTDRAGIHADYGGPLFQNLQIV